MSTVEGDVVLTQDRSSGTIHKRVRLAGSGELASFEGDNLDAAGEYDVLEGGIDSATRPFRTCERCFPDDQPEPTVAPV